VNTEDFTPSNSTGAGSSVRLLFAGDLLPVKGLDFLFKALMLAGEAPVELWIAGRSTPYFESLRAGFAALFESGRVRMLGRLNHDALKKTYSNADMVVLPSSYDQCPQVMLEAMAMGKPVIVSDRIGSRHMVLRGGGGFVVEYGNAEGLMRTIMRMADDPALRRQCGEKARTTAQTVSSYAGKEKAFPLCVVAS
jgi:spore coat protein SA